MGKWNPEEWEQGLLKGFLLLYRRAKNLNSPSLPCSAHLKTGKKELCYRAKKSGLLRSDDDDEEMLNAFPPEWTKWGGGGQEMIFCLGNRSLDRKKRVREKEMMGWIRIVPINKPCWSRFWFINRVRFLCSIPSGRDKITLIFLRRQKSHLVVQQTSFPKKRRGEILDFSPL